MIARYRLHKCWGRSAFKRLALTAPGSGVAEDWNARAANREAIAKRILVEWTGRYKCVHVICTNRFGGVGIILLRSAPHRN